MSEAKDAGLDAADLEDFVRVEVVAKLFGLTVRRVQQLTQEGIISTVKTKGRGSRYELVPTIQNYVRYLSDKATGKSKTDVEVKLKQQKLKAEIALKESQGELHRLRTDIAAGKYISVEEAKVDYSRFFIVFKKFAMSLPARIAGRLSGAIDPVEARRIEKEMQADIKKLLKDFVISATVDKNGET